MNIDRRDRMPPVELQQGGMCVGSAGRAVLYDVLGVDIDSKWLYKKAQTMDEWPGENYDGTSIVAALRVLEEANFQFSYSHVTISPQPIDKAIHQGSLLCSIKVGDGFLHQQFDEQPPNTFNSINPFSTNTSNHAVAVVGYTDTHYIVRNSYGSQYGENGYFYVNKQVFCNIANAVYAIKPDKNKKKRRMKQLLPIVGIVGLGLALAAYLLFF